MTRWTYPQWNAYGYDNTDETVGCWSRCSCVWRPIITCAREWYRFCFQRPSTTPTVTGVKRPTRLILRADTTVYQYKIRLTRRWRRSRLRGRRCPVMAYDANDICSHLRRHLRRHPGLTRMQVSVAMRIDRHTLTRALRAAGASFEGIQREIREEILAQLEERAEPCSGKEIASHLELKSTRALQSLRKRRA